MICGVHGRRMVNLQNQIEERVNAMVGEILVVVRRAAIEAVNQALSGASTAVSPRPRSKPGKRQSQPAAPRRSPEQLASQRERLYTEISELPGEGMALYASKLQVPVRALSLPARQLRKAQRVRTVGQRERMRYFPMGDG